MEDIFSGDERQHRATVTRVRALLSERVSEEVSDADCLRYLRASEGGSERVSDPDCLRYLRASEGGREQVSERVREWRAAVMASEVVRWRHALLPPLPATPSLRLSPNIILGE